MLSIMIGQCKVFARLLFQNQKKNNEFGDCECTVQGIGIAFN